MSVKYKAYESKTEVKSIKYKSWEVKSISGGEDKTKQGDLSRGKLPLPPPCGQNFSPN